jgi:hypothetical protein
MHSSDSAQQSSADVNVFITSGHGTRVALNSPRLASSIPGSAASSSGANWVVELAGQMLAGEGLLKHMAVLPSWGNRRSDDAAR